MEILTFIQQKAEEIFPKIVAHRRALHQNPELAFEEYQTAEFVQKELEKLKIPYQKGIAKTGVVGLIEGKLPGKTIALRADMDALPICELNTFDFKSKNEGKMHACGHDAHTASLLGTAEILNELKEYLSGTIKLIFQPSEEKAPGGASVMIQEGVLKNPNVDCILGQHVSPNIPTGKIGLRAGMYMASADEIYLTIYGKGGHGAQPHTTIDPVAIAAQLITTLQQIVSRKADPRIPTVLTFGKFIANGATNVIPEKVYLEGTFRTFNEQWRNEALEWLTQITHQLVTTLGGKAELNIVKGYPVLYNDEKITHQTKKWIESYVGPQNVMDLDLWTAAEDFAFYTHEIPGCFYRLGTGNEQKNTHYGLHTPQFNIDEDALKISTGLMAWIAYNELKGN